MNHFHHLQTVQINLKNEIAKLVLTAIQSGSTLSLSEDWNGDPTEFDALCDTWLSGDEVVTVSWLDWLSFDARDLDADDFSSVTVTVTPPTVTSIETPLRRSVFFSR